MRLCFGCCFLFVCKINCGCFYFLMSMQILGRCVSCSSDVLFVLPLRDTWESNVFNKLIRYATLHLNAHCFFQSCAASKLQTMYEYQYSFTRHRFVIELLNGLSDTIKKSSLSPNRGNERSSSPFL